MVTVRWHAELGWHDARVGPLTAFSLHPATMALHYGQTIFEGMKAFWRPNGQRALFRPVDHARRFARSARRMAMPTLPEQDFVAALEALLWADGAWVPRARRTQLLFAAIHDRGRVTPGPPHRGGVPVRSDRHPGAARVH